MPSEAVPGSPYLESGWEGPQGQWEGQPGQWGWPEISGKGHSLREPALGLGSVPPPSLVPGETEPGQREAQKYTMFY